MPAKKRPNKRQPSRPVRRPLTPPTTSYAPRKAEESDPEGALEVEGTISQVLAGTMFRVTLPNGHVVLAHISGKMRKRFIKLVIGDRVRMEMSPYDTTKARITFRM
jgi:translation initiation factor IF-1